MFYNAKNGYITLGKTVMDYISFGRGTENLIIISGLGDGLQTVRGLAVPFALMYRIFAKEYKVYVFSRKRVLEPGYSTKDMAVELKLAMDELQIGKAHVLGVSQGGMIAQHLAINYPERVERLVLAVTASQANDGIKGSINTWAELAKRDAFREFMVDNIRKMYTEEYLQKNKWVLWTAGIYGKPKSYDRFLIMAEACVKHDCFQDLKKITAPTLVIGGEKDLVVGPRASRDIAEQVEGCQLKMYPQYGHALYEEAKDFNEVVLGFLREGRCFTRT